VSNVLDGLLAKIDDPALKVAIADEVGRLRDTKQFGLVFERHLPETAKLTNHPVRRDARVQRRAQGEQANGIVTAVADGKATVTWEDGETEQVPADELVVVARFGEPIYPGLKSLGRVARGGDKPFHTVINAENYHALQLLQFTHSGKVDVIYIDPPYNTGKKAEWRYNDRWVSSDDTFRHSKWLSFMDRRLRLARDLLRRDGLLLISIDDNELHHLRALCDAVFGEDRWMATFVWRTDGNIDNQAKIKINHEYIVCLSPSPDDFAVSATIDPNTKPDSKLHSPEIRNSVVKNGPKNPVSEIEIPAGFPASFDEGSILRAMTSGRSSTRTSSSPEV
jgi:adenine-specific DNA-methyltransferase